MTSVRLASGQEVRVGKIVGIGRNYARHAREMGGAVAGAPIFFLKPATSIVQDGGTVLLPPSAGPVHHEIELAVVIGTTARRVEAPKWSEFVLGYGVLLDMTARDLQEEARKRGDPWDHSKGFDTFCPISAITEASRVADPQAVELELRINGQVRQKASTRDMVFPVPRLIEYVSRMMTLERGDVIATGTPEGVGPVHEGDRLEAVARGVATLRVNVARGS